MRVFLDANVLFSAAKTDGAVRKLLRMLQQAGHECWADHYVVFEARRNLTRKGPEALAALDALVDTCRIVAAQAAATNAKDVAWLPEKDRPVLEAAIHAQCDVLVTGDSTHFGSGFGKVFAGVAIHSPSSLAVALLS